MTALVDGDLSVRSQVTLAGAFAQLRDSVNRTSEYVSAAVGNTQQAVESIDTAAAEIASGNADLSDRTEQQPANLEEAAATMEELTSTVRLTSDNANQARPNSTEAAQRAREGGEAVKAKGSRQVHVGGAVDAMVESSVQVAAIVGEISAATQEQTSGIEQINHTVTEMDRVTQQNAALVEEVSAASHSMEDQARTLAKVVAQFRLASSDDAAREAALGINFEAMVNGHQAGSENLFDFMGGMARRSIQCGFRDDACKLGKWIYGEDRKSWVMNQFGASQTPCSLHSCRRGGWLRACARHETGETTLVGPFVEHTTRTVSALRSLRRAALRDTGA